MIKTYSDKDYEKMWKNLKGEVVSNINYYHKGEMCSIQEAIQGETQWEIMALLMKKIEDGMYE